MLPHLHFKGAAAITSLYTFYFLVLKKKWKDHEICSIGSLLHQNCHGLNFTKQVRLNNLHELCKESSELSCGEQVTQKEIILQMFPAYTDSFIQIFLFSKKML